MRKLIVQEWLSADGFAADENGTTDFFGPTEANEQSDKDILADMDALDTILLGANTYKMFLDFWPTEKAANEIIADRINQTPKIVFSNSLQQVEWGKWDTIQLQTGDAVDRVKELKQQDGKDMVLWGSLTLFRSLLAAGLVDELQLRTVPVILGKGIRLFGQSGQIRLKTLATKTYDSGYTLVSYGVES